MSEQLRFSRRRFLQAISSILALPAFVPLRRVFASTPAPSSSRGSEHLVVVRVTDKDNVWYARTRVGNDPTVAAQVVRFSDVNGNPHRGLDAWFYADCVEVGACAADNAYGYVNCFLDVTYDGEQIPHAPSSKPDGTVDFWRGCRMPPIRYGQQVSWDASKIDWSILPSFDRTPQAPWDDSGRDYSFNGLGCATTPDMGQGGARDDIGYLPVWDMAFITNPTDATWGVVRRASDHAGVWGLIYISDPDTGGILDIDKYPQATTLPPQQAHGRKYRNNPVAEYGGYYDGETLTPSSSAWHSTDCPYTANGAHLTAYALLAAMITGTARDRDHASFWCNWTLLEGSPYYVANGAIVNGSQRRFAWCFRNLFVGGYISSDQTYFRKHAAKQLPFATGLATHPLGLLTASLQYRGTGEAKGYMGIAPWMHSYLCVTMDAVSYKLPEWKPFAQYLAKWAVAWQQKPWVMMQTIYNFMCIDSDGNPLTDFRQMAYLSFVNNGYTAAEASAILDATTVEEAYDALVARYTAHNKNWRGQFAHGVSDLRGAITAPDSYPAMTIAAGVAAYNSGAPGTQDVLDYMQNLPTKPDYRRNGKFKLVPRV